MDVCVCLCVYYIPCCIFVGVKLVEGGDSLGQQYTTPEDVIRRKTCDIIIVGRGITESVDPVATAIHYQQAGYAAYVSLFH